jgi:hypothetical protein
MEFYESSRQETHSFRRLVLIYANCGAEIKGKTTYPLLKNRAQQLCLEGKRTEKSGTEAVKSVVRRVVVLHKPIIQ